MSDGGIEKELVSLIEKAVRSVLSDLGKAASVKSHEIKPELEIPREKSNGDISTNMAMKASKFASMPPMQLAGLITEKISSLIISTSLKNDIVKIEAKAPGFINFFLSNSYLYRVLLQIQREKSNFGRGSKCRSKSRAFPNSTFKPNACTNAYNLH